MAKYRNVHTSFWEDTKVLDMMSPEDKYFMLYLLTNPHTTQCGCYEISITQISNETGYNKDTINKLLTRFEDVLNVIKYSCNTNEVLILNWYKYNWTTSPKVEQCIKNELKLVKNVDFKKYFDTVCIPYVYPINTHSQEEKKEEQKKEEEQNKKYICEICNNEISRDIFKKYNNKCKNCFELYMEKKFNIFWSKYPKKVSKENAKKVFLKLVLDDVIFSKILNSLEKFKSMPEWKKDKGQYIPYPATWINQRRWEDEFVVQINENKSSKQEIDPELEKRFNMKVGEIYE